MPTIHCHHCKQPIRTRAELVVVGRSLIALHEGCLDDFNATQSAALRSRPINRWGSWWRFNGVVVVFAGLGALLMPEPSRIIEAWPILAVANGGLLVARLTAWFTLERHLP